LFQECRGSDDHNPSTEQGDLLLTAVATSRTNSSIVDSDTADLVITVALDGSGAAILTTSILALGSHLITATYSGDAGLLGAQSGPVSESVGQSRTTVVLVPHPILTKKKLKRAVLTAEIEPMPPGGGIPAGMVTFELLTKKKRKVKTKVLGSESVIRGDATLSLKPKALLQKVITVVYSGDTNFEASILTTPKLTKKRLL
jgi:hypothetical protein